MMVCKNRNDYQARKRALSKAEQLQNLGKDEPNALIVEIPLPRDVHFKLAGAGADAGMDFADSSVRLTDFNTIHDIKQSALVLCQAILAGYAPPKDIPTNVMLMQMKVYRNQAEYEKEERRQLTSTTQLLGLGNDKDNVLIVEVSLPPRERDVFFELAGADAGIDFTNTRAASVRLAGLNSINDLKREVLGSSREILTGYMPNDLVVYANKDSTDALIEHTQIMRYGASATSALVVKVPSQPSKRVKLLWQKTLTFEPAASTLPLGEECRVWQIDSTTIAGFGICESDENLVLFCRDDATKLVRFLQDEVVHEGKTGYILGPPGSGKSTTAAAFALVLVRASAWIVTWIHLYRDAPPTCVRLEGNKKKNIKVKEVDALETLDQILSEVDYAKQHVVFLDGVTGEDGDKVRLCTGWLRNRFSTCRLVIVQLMSTREKVKPDDDRDLKIQEFLVSSWTWEEYVAAIQDETLFQAVQGHLDAFDGSMPGGVSLKDWRESLLLSKYYFAGGSARYMFGFSTATVIKSLDEAVEAVDNVLSSAAGSLGGRSARMINRLYGQFGGTRGLISRYAASSLTILGGGELIKRFASILRKDSNAAMEGWILEMYFFACIRGNGVSVYEGETEIKFPRCDIVTVDVGTRTNRKKLPKLPTKCWLKPKQFNQGGYDAVYIDQDEKLVRFVQLTKSDRHSFCIEFFSVLLTSLVEAMSEVKMLDIFFVVEKQSLRTFESSTVTGQGNLLHYGWLQGKEIDKVRRVAIEGVESWDVLKW